MSLEAMNPTDKKISPRILSKAIDASIARLTGSQMVEPGTTIHFNGRYFGSHKIDSSGETAHFYEGPDFSDFRTRRGFIVQGKKLEGYSYQTGTDILTKYPIRPIDAIRMLDIIPNMTP